MSQSKGSYLTGYHRIDLVRSANDTVVFSIYDTRDGSVMRVRLPTLTVLELATWLLTFVEEGAGGG